MNKEDEVGLVENTFDKFKQIYHPIWQDKFKDVCEISNGKFHIDSNDNAAKRLLSMHINDNVLQNIEKFSVLLFDKDLKYNKQELTATEKEVIVDHLVEENNI